MRMNILTLIRLITFFTYGIATDIKWVPNNDEKSKSAAATAPRSQKYWDEHNIERPDYAKTDWEIAQEKREKRKKDGNGEGISKYVAIICIILSMIGGLVLGKSNSHGDKLSNASFLSSVLNDRKSENEKQEIARKARLDRFEYGNGPAED